MDRRRETLARVGQFLDAVAAVHRHLAVVHPVGAFGMESGARVGVLLAELGFHPLHAGPDENGIARADLEVLPFLGGFEVRDGHVFVRLVPIDAPGGGDVEQDAAA